MPVYNLYVKLDKSVTKDSLKKEVEECYSNNKLVRIIFDTTDSEASVDRMKAIKCVFDDLKETTNKQMVEAVIIVSGDLKRQMIRTFLDNMKKSRPVRII